MTTNKLAELYTAVLHKEEELEIAREELIFIQGTDRLGYDNALRQIETARDALLKAQREFSTGVTEYSKVHSNIPFYRKSKKYTVKLKHRTVTFFFNQRGIPSFA